VGEGGKGRVGIWGSPLLLEVLSCHFGCLK
jgi:hypothetical protein